MHSLDYSPPSRWAVAKSVLQMASSKYRSPSLFKFQPSLSSYGKYKFLVYPQPKLILEKALVHQHARCKKSNQLRKAHKEILVHTLDYRVWQAKGDTAVVYRSDTSSVGVIYKTCHPSQTTPTLFYWELAIPL